MVMQSGEPGVWKTEGLEVEETVKGEPSPTLDLLAGGSSPLSSSSSEVSRVMQSTEEEFEERRETVLVPC